MTKRLKFPSNLMVFVYSALLLLIPGVGSGQTAPVAARDPNAVALASRALQALAGGTALNEITLQASATYIAGSDQETGPATLVALGNQQSRVTLNLTSGQRQEIRSGIGGGWVGSDAAPHAMATRDCFLDAPWFFPEFTLAAIASDSTLLITLVGQEVHNSQQVCHPTLFYSPSGRAPDVAALIQRVSGVELSVDSTTLVPVALDFNPHRDNDANFSGPVKVRYNPYKFDRAGPRASSRPN